MRRPSVKLIEPFREEKITTLIDTLFGLFPPGEDDGLEQQMERTYVQKLNFIHQCLLKIDPVERQEAAAQVLHSNSSPTEVFSSYFICQSRHYRCSLFRGSVNVINRRPSSKLKFRPSEWKSINGPIIIGPSILYQRGSSSTSIEGDN